MVEPSARFEEIKIRLPDPVHGLEEVSAVLGIPRWWPTGSRVSVLLAHDKTGDMNDPTVAHVHRQLTERRYLTLRFNFPFAEARRSRPDSVDVLRRTLRAALGALGRDPTAAPAHLFLGGKGLGGQVALDLASSRLRVDGLFLMSYPLHPAGPARQAPGRSAVPHRQPGALPAGQPRPHLRSRRAAPHADARRRAERAASSVRRPIATSSVPKKSPRTSEEVRDEIAAALDEWIQKVLGDTT